ncbi:MAG: pantetheine-phosphate adenylyltransferase [Bacteroidales bacterium]|jgi:pantetheine-phosphate adenylyltransferase|nr:pantetheine-phosphate adenylyltransferase [Bacteroidales bacterium]
MIAAIYPGSFDPITKGHQSIALRASNIFDHLIIAIGKNTDKQYMFSMEERLLFVQKTFADIKKITVVSYDGLTIDFCKKNNIHYIVRGLRSDMDWGIESTIAHANRLLSPLVETLFLLTEPQYAGISSSVVRDILINRGDVTAFVPDNILDMINK